MNIRFNRELDTIYIEALVSADSEVDTEVKEALHDVFVTEDNEGKVYALEVINFNSLYPNFFMILDIHNISKFPTPH